MNYASKPVLEEMKASGCVFINYGNESLDNETLKVMNKALSRQVITKGIEKTFSEELNRIYSI